MIIKNRILIISIFFIPFCQFAQPVEFTEYEVKAAYLEKFTRFIEWPGEDSIDAEQNPFIIGIIGENPFDSILEEMYLNEKIKNKNVKIRYISQIEEIGSCNLLFVPKSEDYRINKIMSYTGKRPILTISDYPRFAKMGIQITLFVQDEYVYFDINQNALIQSGLYISSLLLNLSRSINVEENK